MTALLVVELLLIFWLIIMHFVNARRIGEIQHQGYRRSVFTLSPTPPKEPEAICGCKHHKCFHDDDGCGYAYTNINSEDSIVKQMMAVELTCPCKGYMGPEHLPTVLP